MQRLERLLNLTAALLTASRPLTAVELRERVPGYPAEGSDAAFRRALERDKDALREMGIPLVLVPIEGVEPPVEGYVIPRDQYELRDPGLEPDELAAIHLASAAVELEGLRTTEALWKLGGAPAAGESPPVAALPATPTLAPLFGAVSERRQVTFGYRAEARTVDPWRLSFTRGHWYLEGWDHGRGAARQFRLDRMEGTIDASEPGSARRPDTPPSRPTQPWELGEGEPVVATVRVDADQAGWAVDHLGREAVLQEGDDGSVVVTCSVTNLDAFRSFVLGFLDHAEVIGPPELRDDIVAWLRAVA
jgi:proteasome accessory factor B